MANNFSCSMKQNKTTRNQNACGFIFGQTNVNSISDTCKKLGKNIFEPNFICEYTFKQN
jgi:hypothetical protein